MAYNKLTLILGNCLFSNHDRLKPNSNTLFFMAEDYELCTHYRYHKHKLILFLSAMRSHAEKIREDYPLAYHALTIQNKARSYEEKLKETLDDHPDIQEIVTYDIEDHFFDTQIKDFCDKEGLELTIVDSPGFLTTQKKFARFNKTYKPFMQTFYKQQRKDLGILMHKDSKSPLHGQWSFDEDNRKKLPKHIDIPEQPIPHPTAHTEEVKLLVSVLFADHPGEAGNFHWATTRNQVLHLLNDFVNTRLDQFGPYEDAIDSKEVFVFHTVLSPYINMGLITPDEIVEKVLAHHSENDTHYPSVEGLIRQIIGWREFMRGIYHEYDQRLNTNYFNHHRKMKACWYEGNTGVPPLDDSIKKALKYGYTHHIERLMVLGNIMLLCELDPEEVYKWFMEMYVDSADWVMAPNVYGMSQYADGGIFATKPYIGGANYIRKMSNYGKGEWEDIVNGLYWRFISENLETFENNQRMSMMVATLKRMNTDKKEKIFKAANDFITKVTH